jgi:hypothetical protein
MTFVRGRRGRGETSPGGWLSVAGMRIKINKIT